MKFRELVIYHDSKVATHDMKLTPFRLPVSPDSSLQLLSKNLHDFSQTMY